MEFKKIYESDFDQVIPLLRKFDTELGGEKSKLLFKKNWCVSIDFCGVAIADNNEIIAYLGLFFSDRIINGKSCIFCNLSSLIIDERYRGQKLSHKIIQYLQSLGDFSLTAITPIPSLYKMYSSNGFISLDDFRTILWKYPFAQSSQKFSLLSNYSEIQNYLNVNELKIFTDHKYFNCRILLFKTDNDYALLIIKNKSSQRKKFLTSKPINYINWFTLKFFEYSFLDSVMICPEVHYCSNYKFFINNIAHFSTKYFSQYPKYTCFCLRSDFAKMYQLKYPLKSNFRHSRQMFFSRSLPPESYDTLYSEIFVLDM